ncbi:MAG TPA: DUF2905 domain-containing protein [Chlorobaculum sp.]|nr:DUF2905 domain-containing protein [Chlorobaculum sp.]
MLVFIGASIAIIGLLIVFAQKSGGSGLFGWFGNLPFDIRIQKDNFRFYFPIGSSIVLSILLSLIIAVINKFIR